jgi:phage/plasmid-like protein (TIGR03299 family)
MAHMIENLNGKDCHAYVGQKPWHGLGIEVPADIQPLEILRVAGLDWRVEEVPSYIDWDGKKLPTGDKSLVRDIDGKILTSVSDNWRPCQNIEAFNFFQEFVDAGDMTMETAGSLNDGKLVWAMAKVKDTFELFNGDEVESYLLFSNPHEYGKSINIRFVAERVVCANTMAIALSEKAKTFARFSHRREFNPDLVKELLGMSHGYMEKYKETATFLGSKLYTPDSAKAFVMELFPVVQAAANKNDKPRKEISKTAKQILETVLDDQPGLKFARGSYWQLFNAVTFYTNHLAGRTTDTRVNSLWYGSSANINIKALSLAAEYAKKAA